MGIIATGEAASQAASDVAGSDLSADVKIILICTIAGLLVLAVIVWLVKREMKKEEAANAAAAAAGISDGIHPLPSNGATTLLNPSPMTEVVIDGKRSSDHDFQDTRALLAPDDSAIERALPSPLPTMARAHRESARYC